MQKTTYEFVPNVDFKEVTPEVLTEREKRSSLYEKAFFSHEETNNSEFCQNTTTWD